MFEALLLDPAFLALFCPIFPALVLKLLRLPVASARPLLAEGAVDRVVLLVRDPRATMHSRYSTVQYSTVSTVQ